MFDSKSNERLRNRQGVEKSTRDGTCNAATNTKRSRKAFQQRGLDPFQHTCCLLLFQRKDFFPRFWFLLDFHVVRQRLWITEP
jgi:hypothetical protein